MRSQENLSSSRQNFLKLLSCFPLMEKVEASCDGRITQDFFLRFIDNKIGKEVCLSDEIKVVM